VYLWNAHDGRRRLPLVGHSHAVWGLAFSREGRLIATASQDKTARIWEVDNPSSFSTLEGHQDTVWAVAFSPDNRFVATASHDRTVKLWSANEGRLLATLTGHMGLVRSLAFSPDGRALATVSGDGTIRLWHLHDATERCDWSCGVPALPPRPLVTLTASGNGVVYPGDELWLDIEVENAGRGDLVQLRAHVDSATPLLRGLSAYFGRIAPGDKAHRCVSVCVPNDFPPSELRGQLVFHEANDYQPANGPIDFQVRALPRDDFLVQWHLVDDGSGNSFGVGDGRPRRGECVDVVVEMENQTGDELPGIVLTLLAVDLPTGVLINIPQIELGPMAHGASAEGRLTFSVKPSAQIGVAEFELRVATTDGRQLARMGIETVVE
jgi:hypothetical protein